MGVGIKHWYGEKNKKRSRFGSIPAVWHVPLLVHIHYDSAEGACNIQYAARDAAIGVVIWRAILGLIPVAIGSPLPLLPVASSGGSEPVAVAAASASEAVDPVPHLRCVVCDNMLFTSVRAKGEHLVGKKHRRRLAALSRGALAADGDHTIRPSRNSTQRLERGPVEFPEPKRQQQQPHPRAGGGGYPSERLSEQGAGGGRGRRTGRHGGRAGRERGTRNQGGRRLEGH